MEQKPRIEKIAKWATIGWVAALVCWCVINIVMAIFLPPYHLILLVPGAEESLSYVLYTRLNIFIAYVISPLFLVSFPVATFSLIGVSIIDFLKHMIRKKVLVLAAFHSLIVSAIILTLFNHF